MTTKRQFVLPSWAAWGFKPNTEFLAKGTVARVISAWRSASQRGQKKRTAAEADHIAGDLPRTLPKKKHLELIRAHNELHKELVEKSVDMYLENLEANRITYKLKWAFQFLDYDKVLEALDKRLKNKPTIHTATELYNTTYVKKNIFHTRGGEVLTHLRKPGV